MTKKITDNGMFISGNINDESPKKVAVAYYVENGSAKSSQKLQFVEKVGKDTLLRAHTKATQEAAKAEGI